MDPSQQARPLLHTACLLGDEENVLKILASGANINEVDFAGCSAIQLSAAAGHLNIVKLLLQHGAKPEIQDATHGNTSLHESSWRGYSSLVKVLSSQSTVNIQNHGGFTPLHLACQAGHNQSTRELLITGANPNLMNTYGDTPLHTSVRYGHAGVCRILLSARAEADVQNKNGDTALHISSAMHRKKLTKILLSSACTPSLRNNQNETPADICRRKDFQDVLHVLENPPDILTPMQRDEMRASKFMPGPSTALTTTKATVHAQGPNPTKRATLPLMSGSSGSGTAPPTLRQQMVALLGGSRKSIAGNTAKEDHKIRPGSSQSQIGRSKGSGSRNNNSSSNLHSSRKGVVTIVDTRARVGSGSGSGSKDQNQNHESKSKVNNNIVSAACAGAGSVRVSDNVADEPKWSPYGCHHAHTGSFPKPNIDSLPNEPLTTGELYYLDLAGNIHKGPMGVSEGCYCNTLLSQNQSGNNNNNSQSMLALNSNHHHHHHDHNAKAAKKASRHRHHNSKQELHGHGHSQEQEPQSAAQLIKSAATVGKGTKYEDQLKSLTSQLSKIHLDTQAQLSSLHSILNERLKDGESRPRRKRDRDVNANENEGEQDNEENADADAMNDEDQEFDATKLKEWVKQYRRFRKEIAKNPKMLHQANELLASASTLLSTRLASPQPVDSDTDSGL